MIHEVDPADAASPIAGLDAVARACADADRVAPLNEQAQLRLKNHGLAGSRLWVSTSDPGSPVDGFALLRGENLDLAVHPDVRREGRGGLLAAAALADVGHVEAWSHADHPAAARLAEHFGLMPARELVVMRRPTALPLTEPPVPPGVRIRTFRPDDEAALLDVNATAFAHHPEQGGMSHADFTERAAEAWFDPEGLFLAVPDDPAEAPLLGFHWTKVHRDEEPAYGEVYVVAVSPQASGRGLGTLLTAVGLRHLAEQGVGEVILYVEGDNRPAIAVYTKLGFEVARTEVQYLGTPTV